jgi:hypothetical protein
LVLGVDGVDGVDGAFETTKLPPRNLKPLQTLSLPQPLIRRPRHPTATTAACVES